jgi:uncharacterized protein (DUF433 family)
MNQKGVCSNASVKALRDVMMKAVRGLTMGTETGNSKGYQERIVRDRAICGGEPIFRGTRVTLRTVLASLGSGDSIDEILADFPCLKVEDVQAAIAFAASSAEEDLPVPPLPRLQ